MGTRNYFNGNMWTRTGRVDFPVLAIHLGEQHKPTPWNTQTIVDPQALKTNFERIGVGVPVTIAVPQIFAMLFPVNLGYEKVQIDGFNGDPYGTGPFLSLTLSNVVPKSTLFIDGADVALPKPQKEFVRRTLGPMGVERALKVILFVESANVD